MPAAHGEPGRLEASNSCRVQLIFLLAVPGGETSRYLGSVLNSGARLYEPQHIAMQSKPLRVADPRSENKLRHCCYLQLLASLAKLDKFRKPWRNCWRPRMPKP